MDTTFGAWLKARLQHLGLKQEAFAGLMGVRQGTVSRWANGGDIKIGYIHRMAEVLGVSVAEIAAAAAGEPPPRQRERVRRVPVIGLAAADPAGGADLDDQAEGRLYILIVDGDCLAPRIEPGDALLMDREGSARVGDIVEVRVGSERHVKELIERNGEWILMSKRGRLVLPPDGVNVEGVMVKVLTEKRF